MNREEKIFRYTEIVARVIADSFQPTEEQVREAAKFVFKCHEIVDDEYSKYSDNGFVAQSIKV